ncbi:hypothetical protein Vadar_002703 [Vaccinium darrowii]|uniref:Uncharacterized protein n=1 Tax=Vaccinium darrowii TaxID=229202 RepID=A0ACB7Z8Y4_9ERIC|nr:hypothetical protein Vadar_002703 [Vaccinium darrowii]
MGDQQKGLDGVVARILPEVPHRLPGRPRKVRRRAVDEPAAGTSESKRSQTVKCTWCKEFGHNKRTCQRGPVRDRGGPRGRGNTHNNGRVGASGNKIGGTVTAASTTSTGRGRGIYRGRGGGQLEAGAVPQARAVLEADPQQEEAVANEGNQMQLPKIK